MSTYDIEPPTRLQLESLATSRGLVARWPTAREVFVDIDGPAQMDAFLASLRKAQTIERMHAKATPSPSGKPGRYHVVVTLERDLVDERERVFLQALLCSDPVREWLAWRKLYDGARELAVSVFFEVP